MQAEQKLEQQADQKHVAAHVDNPVNIDAINGFECPITGDIMADPVTASDGHSYERAAIEQWFSGGHITSPITNARLSNRTLTPNHNLRQAIDAYRQQERATAALLQEQASQAASQSALLSNLGVFPGTQAGLQATHQRLGQRVLDFVRQMQAFISTQQGTWDPNAAMGFVGTAVSSILKGSAAYTQMLAQPAEHSLPPAVATLIETYVRQHQELWTLKDCPHFAHELKRDLYQGKIMELQQRFAPADEKVSVMSAQPLGSNR